jgi:hypothetical protein
MADVFSKAKRSEVMALIRSGRLTVHFAGNGNPPEPSKKLQALFSNAMKRLMSSAVFSSEGVFFWRLMSLKSW